MKLILAGSTGLVGTEVLRQCLLNPKITSLIALTRRPIDIAALTAPLQNSDAKTSGVEKVKSLVLQDFTEYPEDVKRDLADADACIWALALTPMRSKQHPWNDVVRITRDYCVAGMDVIAEARRAAGNTTPFRFMYVSGRGISHEMTKKPWVLGDYALMRADVERQVFAFAASHADAGWQACVARPGLISGFSGPLGVLKNAAISAIGVVGHTVSVQVCVAAMLQQCEDGFQKDVLANEDMVDFAKR